MHGAVYVFYYILSLLASVMDLRWSAHLAPPPGPQTTTASGAFRQGLGHILDIPRRAFGPLGTKCFPLHSVFLLTTACQ